MAEWKTTLNLADLHTSHKAGEITIQQVAAGVVARLKRNRFAEEWQVLDVIDRLEGVAEDATATADDYDEALSELYDFADRDHQIWVKTA
jgi:hypothetical protein